MNILKQFKSFNVLIAIIACVTIVSLSGCDDSGVVDPADKDNPDVVSFDSILVYESTGNNLCGMNLFYGSTVLRDSASKDVQLVDTNGTGTGFYLRSGELLDFNVFAAGYKTRFNRIYASFSKTQFDTITVLPVNRDTILPALDFTADDTRFLGEYFEPNLSGNQPVYSFYLEGKSQNFHGRNIFGIIQAVEATDSTPGIPGDFRMSFRVRINFVGENDFRQMIPGS